MKRVQSLFAFTRKKMLEEAWEILQQNIQMRDECDVQKAVKEYNIANIFRDEKQVHALAEELAWETQSLWRYARNAAPFAAEQWMATLKSWIHKGSFPVLYKEKCPYDKREVVFALQLVMGCREAQESEVITFLSAGNVSYDGRVLYPLHFKEGFFKLVLKWNQKNADTISFERSINTYEKYEITVLEKCRRKWQDLQDTYGQITRVENDTSVYAQTTYYYQLCESLWKEAADWSVPLGLLQQDELQRLIVLQAHLQRHLEEYQKHSQADIVDRNRYTRNDIARGTKYCEALLQRCCRKEKWEDAVSLYVEEALPAIGEACWRSVSKWMKAYSASGQFAKEYDKYLSLPVRSVRNKVVKQYKKVPVFSADVPADVRYMSFAVDAEEIRQSIMGQSANTSMIAQLLQPQLRTENILFAKQSSDVSQAALSLFLRSYFLWCEGKTGMKSQGIDRIPLPFYDYKRDMVIRFALACGCASSEELGEYLEFTGNAGLNLQNPAERLVAGALEWYASLSYDEKQSTSPVEVILTMQHYYLYHLASVYQKKHGFTVDENVIVRYVRKYQVACIYEPGIAEFSVKNSDQTNLIGGKQENLQRYASLWFAVMLLLRCISQQVHSLEKGLSLAKDILQRIWEEKEPFEEEYFCGYLMYVNEPEDAAEEYLEYLSDNCQWSGLFPNVDKIDTEEVMILLQLLSKHLLILDIARESNSMELKLLYEVMFYVLAAVREFVEVSEDSELKAAYGICLNRLQDAVILWTFTGGCRNFALSYYEQRLGINHYGKSHDEVDNTQGNRWLRYLHELKQDQEVWYEIVSDLGTINKSRNYIAKRRLLDEAEIAKLQQPLTKRVEECRETLVHIITHLEAHDCEDNLVKQLRYIYQHVSV